MLEGNAVNNIRVGSQFLCEPTQGIEKGEVSGSAGASTLPDKVVKGDDTQLLVLAVYQDIFARWVCRRWICRLWCRDSINGAMMQAFVLDRANECNLPHAMTVYDRFSCVYAAFI